MSKYPESFESDSILRRAIAALPVPLVSAEFDERVHSRLQRSTPWWRILWATARPVLGAAALSLVATLLLLRGFAGTTATPTRSGSTNVLNFVLSSRRTPYVDVLDRMERIDASGTSWHMFTIAWWPSVARPGVKPESLPRAIVPAHRTERPTNSIG